MSWKPKCVDERLKDLMANIYYHFLDAVEASLESGANESHRFYQSNERSGRSWLGSNKIIGMNKLLILCS